MSSSAEVKRVKEVFVNLNSVTKMYATIFILGKEGPNRQLFSSRGHQFWQKLQRLCVLV